MSVQSEIDRIKAVKEDIRAAIVEKGQSVPATAPLSSYGDKIRAIQTGTDTSDATAAAGDILSGKTAYVKGKKVMGTIASRSAGNLTASRATVTVPAGYYPNQVSKSVASATQATPSLEVSPAGLITASATQGAGYVAGGTKSATKQLPTLGAQAITPGTADQHIAFGQYLTGAQTIKGDANLVAGNIKKGVSIFGVEGAFDGYSYPFSVKRSGPYGRGRVYVFYTNEFYKDEIRYSSIGETETEYQGYTKSQLVFVRVDVSDALGSNYEISIQGETNCVYTRATKLSSNVNGFLVWLQSTEKNVFSVQIVQK